MTLKPVTLWILIGLPGSGKSTWAEQFSQSSPPMQLISTDQIRRLLFGHEATQGPWLKVWQHVVQQMQYSVAEMHLHNLSGAIYDATNVQRRGRRKVIQTARAIGFTRITAVWFDVPIPLCLQRNAQRSRQVPPEVVRAMSLQLAGAPPDWREGFEAVYRLGSGMDGSGKIANP